MQELKLYPHQKVAIDALRELPDEASVYKRDFTKTEMRIVDSLLSEEARQAFIQIAGRVKAQKRDHRSSANASLAERGGWKPSITKRVSAAAILSDQRWSVPIGATLIFASSWMMHRSASFFRMPDSQAIGSMTRVGWL